MLIEPLTSEELLNLVGEKGGICVSITVPTHKLSPERRIDDPVVKKAIGAAKEFLDLKYPGEKTKPLMESLDTLYHNIDFLHNSEGLGLFVSSRTHFAVQFPFPVEEKVMVGDNFEIRDLLYKINCGKNYFLLMLSKHETRLFKGRWSNVEEIIDKNFPQKYKEEYIYSRPSRSTSYAGYAHVKSFENDKSVVEETRLKNFFNRTDLLLINYLINHSPLVIMGADEVIASFRNSSAYSSKIVHSIEGNFEFANLKELADKAWPAVSAHFNREIQKLINDFDEKVGEHLAVSGIQEVWHAASEGRGETLLVEKDFRKPGFIGVKKSHLFLRSPKIPHKILADAVDDIIEMILQKNGKVFFTENGKLKKYKHIALITRY